MARGIVVWLVINATITTYLAYRQYSRSAAISDDERELYDDL
jgi:hypothetical protein